MIEMLPARQRLLVLLLVVPFAGCADRACPLPLVGGPAVRGDANGDGAVDLADGVFLHRAFSAGGPPAVCEAASEMVVASAFDAADALALWSWLYAGLGALDERAADACPEREAGVDGAACGRMHFELVGPDRVSGAPGGAVAFDGTVRLLTRDLAVDGWSLALAADGCVIDAVDADGTVAADARDGGLGLRDMGYAHLVAASDGGSATAAVVLSWLHPTTLPPGKDARPVLAVHLSAPVPTEGCRSCVVSFADGIRGPGQPVDNRVVAAGRSYAARGIDVEVEVCAD